MNRALESILRPLYRKFIHLPAVRRAIVRAAATVSTDMNIFADFVENGHGEEYGLTRRARELLVRSFDRNCRRIQSSASADIDTVLAIEVLSIPRHLSGDVIACGPFKGASPANLSLVCHITERKLFIHDSCEGLPYEAEISQSAAPCDECHNYNDALPENLKEIEKSIRKYGDISACELLPGLSSQSLEGESFVLACLAVECVDSMKDCLRCIWPRMAEGSLIYSNDARNMDIGRLCFDDGWWQEVLHEPAPGLIGSGCGLPLGPKGSSLSFIRKSRQLALKLENQVSWLQSLEVSDDGRRYQCAQWRSCG